VDSPVIYEVAEGFRLSPQQARVWSLQDSGYRSQCGVQCSIRIIGPINVIDLGQAVARVRSDHEILRTKFAILEGTSVPVQVATETVLGLDTVLDLRGVNGSPITKVKEFAFEQWNQTWEPLKSPPLSFGLVVISDEECQLVITASGLCADAATVTNLIHELLGEYGTPGNRKANKLQYADLAEWQNQLLEPAFAQEGHQCWRAEDFVNLSFPRMPFALRGADLVAFKPETVTISASSATVDRLMLIAQHLGVPLHVIIHAAWQIMLYRLSDSEKFLVGISLDGRIQPELLPAIGPLVRCVPLSVHVDPNSTFSELVRETYSSLTLAQDDQLLFAGEPFGVPPPSQRRCLFPVLFAHREQVSFDVPGPLTWKLISLIERVEPFELMVNTVTGPSALEVELSWDTSMFSAADIKLAADSITALLDEIAADSDRCITDFTMSVANSELDRPVALTERDNKCQAIHELIEHHASRVPERLALVCEEEQITYAELSRRSATLSRRIVQAGVTPDSIVAIVAERSVAFVVGMLAVMKAGAAWLPIEPDIPAERIEYMIRHAPAVAVLTQSGLTLSSTFGALPVIYLEECTAAAVQEEPKSVPAAHLGQVAYVIFTSGSTGRPKGVAVEHKQIAAYVRAAHAKVDLQSVRTFAVVSTMAADLGHTTVFGALTSGGCLHIIPAWRAKDVDALAQYVLQHPIDFLKIVPAHLDALCRALPTSTVLPWRYVFVGGELLTWSLVESLHQLAPDCKVFNHYGPTETTVGVCCGLADPQSEPFQGSGVSIGRPMLGSSVYVLDGNLRPVPTWATGEIYIGGDLVARGYAGAGGATANVFLPDPFSSTPGVRMYRTGDIARYRSDGTIQFLRRRDGQIKINGYRVELGEIEGALCRHPEVRNAAAILIDEPTFGKCLVAWAVVGQSQVKSEQLRQFLEKSLPEHMIPRIIVCVEQLKLTPNGKVDRQALPSTVPVADRSKLEEPLDETEGNLLAVWQSVLGVEQISVNDNYFSLGGDSLRVIQLVHEARRYGITIGATDILRNQSIRRLRKSMQAKLRQGLFPDGIPALELPPLQSLPDLPANVIDVYPLSGMQDFIVGKYAQNQGSQGIYHIQESMHLSDEGFSWDALETAVQTVVDRHPALRTVFNLKGSQPMQWVCQSLSWKVEKEDISHFGLSEQEAHISASLLSDRAHLFDTNDQSAPLFRVKVFLRSASNFELLFSCHHAVMDGWGHRVFTNQLLEAYIAIKSGDKPDLGMPDATYREFVAFQEAVRRSDKARQYWQSYLTGVAATPFRQRDSHGSEQADPSILRPLDSDLTRALVNVARTQAISMQALMLTAWLETLRTLFNQEPVSTGLLTNGRSEYLSDPLTAIGLFWNLVPVVSRDRVQLVEQAALVQRDLLEMEPYTAYPLPQLLADREGQEAFSSVFRYLNFWNTKDLPNENGLELINVRAFDRFSFPLTCSALVGSVDRGGFLHIGYDPGSVSEECAREAMAAYETTLQQIASQ
jgi:amino acid adenylation domain-containing protein